MKKVRIIATLLAMVMVFGSSMSVFATTYQAAYADMHAKDQEIQGYLPWNVYNNDSQKADVLANKTAAGDYLDMRIINDGSNCFYDRGGAHEFCRNISGQNKTNSTEDLSSAEQAAYDNLLTWYSNIIASKATSDGSNYVASGSSSSSSSSSSSEQSDSSSASASSGNDDSAAKAAEEAEEVIRKSYEEAQDAVKNVSASVDAGLKNISAVVATGNASQIKAVQAQGIVVDTTDAVWFHSMNIEQYKKIEEATLAGIPVTLKFAFAGTKFSVTIPAGAKVTQLCDKTGWCGFLNLAANYGFTIIK